MLNDLEWIYDLSEDELCNDLDTNPWIGHEYDY